MSLNGVGINGFSFYDRNDSPNQSSIALNADRHSKPCGTACIQASTISAIYGQSTSLKEGWGSKPTTSEIIQAFNLRLAY